MTTSNTLNLDREVILISIEEEFTDESPTDNSSCIETVESPILVKENADLKAFSSEIVPNTVLKANVNAKKEFKNSYKTKVPSGAKRLEAKVSWLKPSIELRLKTYTPSGKPFSTEYDITNGSVDGIITFRVDSPQIGTWGFEVCGDSNVKYSFKAIAITNKP
jgi:hypothetical protein